MAHGTATRAERLDVPRPIRKALGKLDRRLRMQRVVRALGTSAIVAALIAMTGMAADLVVGLPKGVRGAVWVLWVVAGLAPLAVAVARALARRTKALDLAAVLERSYPELGDRLTATVGLLGDGESHGSPALIAALANEAVVRVGEIAALPSRPMTARGPGRRFVLGLLAVAIVAAPAWIRPEPFAKLARRFAMPWVEADRVGLYVVTVMPGDTLAAIGDDLTVNARVSPRFGHSPARGGAWLEWTENGRARRLAMKEDDAGSAADRAFSLVLPRLPGSLTYRVVSSSGESREFQVTAIAPPAVTAITARVEPPSYTRLPAAIARDPARIEAWEDSRVTLTLATSSPIRAAEVSWPQRVEVDGHSKVEPKRTNAAITGDGRTATITMTADAPGEYAIALRDTHGLTSRVEPPRRIVVRPDEAPLVTLRETEGLDQARADDTLRVGLSASDDIAIAVAELHYSIERAATSTAADQPETGHVAATIPGLGTRSARGEVALGLKKLGVKAGDVISYRARVVDNRPAPRGPNVAWSVSHRLTVVAKADPLWAQRDRAGREAIQAKLDALKKAAAENRHEAELLRYAADAVQRGNGEWDGDRRQALTRREAEARSVVDQLEKLAVDLADTPAFRPLAHPARQVADVEAEAARATLDQARQANDAAKRLAELRQADSRLGAVTARLEELQRGFNTLAEREADRRRLQALADRQSQVADKAGDENQADPDRARLDQLAAEQNAVKTDLDALLKKSLP